MEMITTIKLKKSTKSALDHVKNESESYDSAIKKLISHVRDTHLKSELIEAYKNMGKDDLTFLGEWDSASNEIRHNG